MSMTTTVYPSSSTIAADSRAVRFESQCVLIPEPQAQSLIHKLGKTLVLPLWKRSPEVELDPRARAIEERFGGRGGGQSPKRSRLSPSPARDDPLLVPCIVNHDGPSSPLASSPTFGLNRPSILRRRSSLPTPPQVDVITIPLRPCCVNCETVWEQSQKEGEQWKERFTRGARRRRSLSSDTRPVVHHRHGSLDSTHSFGHAPLLTIKVDEADKWKGSGDSRLAVIDSPIDLPEDSERRHASDSSVPSCLTTTGRVKTPIPEDDEDQLFPLPLNRRSPSASPAPSPSGSSSSLNVTGQKTSSSSSGESTPQRTRIPSPTKSNCLMSPPSPSPITKSFSVPLPPKSLSRSVRSGLPSDEPYVDSETILGPPIVRTPRISRKKSNLWSTGVSITKAAGAGILKGVSSISVSPGTPLA